jgi:hypothetical protein
MATEVVEDVTLLQESRSRDTVSVFSFVAYTSVRAAVPGEYQRLRELTPLSGRFCAEVAESHEMAK